MNWLNIWESIFGTNEFMNLDMGFWVSMTVVAIIVVIMNIVFWSMKPKKNKVS